MGSCQCLTTGQENHPQTDIWHNPYRVSEDFLFEMHEDTIKKIISANSLGNLFYFKMLNEHAKNSTISFSKLQTKR